MKANLVQSKYYLVLFLILSMIFTACGQRTEDQPIIEDTASDVVEITEELQSSGQVLRFVTGDFKPYVNEATNDGFYIDLIREVFGRHNIEVTFDYLPWARGLEAVHNHEYFATIPWSQTSERMRMDVFSNNIYGTNSYVIYMKDNPAVKDDFKETLDLKKYNLGTIANYYYINELLALGFELDSSDSEQEGLTKLYNGRYDVMIMNELAFEQLVEDLFPGERDKFATMSKPYRTNYHGFRVAGDYPDKEKYIELFNKELKHVIEDGTYDKITEKYGVPPVNREMILKQYQLEPIIIGIEDYAPYEFVDEEGKSVGMGLELVKEALLRMGYSGSNIEVVVRPWTRLMEMGNRGEVDMILDAFDTEERRQVYDYSNERYGTYAYKFIALEEKDLSFNGKEFSKPIKSIGLVRGYAYEKEILELLESLEIKTGEVATTDELIEALIKGRFDVIIEAEEFAKFYIKQHGLTSKVEGLGQPLETQKSYIIYPKSRQNTEMRDDIDEMIRWLNQDGTVEKIRNYYLE